MKSWRQKLNIDQPLLDILVLGKITLCKRVAGKTNVDERMRGRSSCDDAAFFGKTEPKRRSSKFLLKGPEYSYVFQTDLISMKNTGKDDHKTQPP